MAALWNQTVEFWHGQQGGGLTPFTDWIVLFFQQAKPSNNVYFWFFEEEVVWPHYLECWSFFDRFRHAERSKQWNQGELPISPFFCLAASLEGRQIQTNQWKVVWPSDPSVKKLQCLIPLPSVSQKCNWGGGQGDPKNHQLGVEYICIPLLELDLSLYDLSWMILPKMKVVWLFNHCFTEISLDIVFETFSWPASLLNSV